MTKKEEMTNAYLNATLTALAALRRAVDDAEAAAFAMAHHRGMGDFAKELFEYETR